MNRTQCQSALFVFCLTRGSAGDSNALRQISLTAVVRKWALKLVEKLIASQRTGYVPNLKVADTSSSPYGKFERLTFECQDVCSEASAPVALWALLLFLLIMFIPARVLMPRLSIAAREVIETWLILPVVICLSQRLSHACLSISFYTAKLRMAH